MEKIIKKRKNKFNFKLLKINNKKNIFNFNAKYISIFLLTIGLGVFGCFMVYSASSYMANYRYGNSYFYLTKQIVGVVLGTCSMFICSLVDYQKLKKFKWWLVGASVVMLVLVFIPGIGVENYGARRWLNFGLFTIQPSEFAKFALVIFSAAYLSENYEKIGNFKTCLPVLAVGLSFCVLIILEPNMSITMCTGLIMIFMLFVGGMKLKHFAFLGVPALSAVPILILAEPYRIKRFMAFLNPWANPQGEGFQLIQSLYSLGSGGLFGVGYGNSRQKYLFLPFSESDFIFSIIGEELGLFGSVVLIVAFLALIYLIISVAKNAKDRFGSLLCLGIASVIAIQTILNICVVSGSIPPTGLPLPFISAGSTSLVVFMSAIGVVLNISKQSKSRV